MSYAKPAMVFCFQTEAQNSRLFKNFPKDVLHSLEAENITSNFHSWSLSLQVQLFKIPASLLVYGLVCLEDA